MFEIISYGGGNLIQQVLNAVAMFFGSGDYLFTMKIVATMAALAVLVQAAFSGRLPDLKWFLVIIFVYMFAFLPKVTVTITDTVERTPGFPFSTPTVRVVSNVPIGLAFVASFTSHMKDYFTKGIETAFSLPNEMSFRTAGPLFAQGIAETSMSAAPKNPATVASLSNFWRDCVFFDIALGFYSMDQVAKADDLMQFLQANVNSNRFYQHINSDGGQVMVACRDSIATGGYLYQALEAEKTEQAQWVSWANNLATKPSSSTNSAYLASGASAMPVAMSYLTGMSVTSSRMLGQTILANSFANGLTTFASQAGAQEVMQSYAAAKAEAERSVTFSTLGKISGRMLPLMNIIAEALIYAVFPIVALFMLWPGGHKAAGAYAMALIWIALWAPMYAIVHFLTAYYSSISVGSAAQICDATNTCQAHLNMYTMRSMKEAFANAAAISGYFAALVPYLAYMVVSRSGAMMAGTVGRLLDGYAQPVSHAAAEASAGNVSMGSMNYENQSAFQHNTAPAQSSGYLTESNGRNTHVESQHIGIDQLNLSRGAYSMNASANVQSQIAREQSEATKITESTQASYAEANANRFNALVSAENSVSHSTGTGVGHGMDKKAGESEALSSVAQQAQSYAEKHGVKAEYMTAAMGELGVKVPGFAGVNAQAKNSDDYVKAQEAARNFITSQDFKSTLDRSESAYMQQTANRSDDVTKAGRDSISNAREESVRTEQSYSAALSHEKSVREAASDINSHGAAMSADVGEYVRRQLAKDDQNWESFNNRLNSGDEAALRQLEAYKDDFARSFVQERVQATAGGIEAEAGEAMSNVRGEGDNAVDRASTDGKAQVGQQRGKDHTTGQDGAQIVRHEAAVSATSDAKRGGDEDALRVAGAEFKGNTNTALSADNTEERVAEVSQTGVIKRTAVEAADNTVDAVNAVANSLTDDGKGGQLPVETAGEKALVGVVQGGAAKLDAAWQDNKPAWDKAPADRHSPNDTAGNTTDDGRPR